MRILWLPHAPWHVPQRAWFFARELAQRHEVWAADADGDFTRLRDLVSRRYLLNALPRRWRDDGVRVQHVPRIAPALYSRRLRRLNDALYGRTVRRLICEEAIDVVVGTFVAPIPEGVPTVADVFDDNVALWREGGGPRAFAAEIGAREHAWIENGRRVVAVSSVLAEAIARDHPRARVDHVPNGVDTRRYRPGRAEARRALGLPPDRRLVGNVGAVSTKGEVERLLAVADRLREEPDTELLLVGGGAAQPALRRAVEARGLRHVHCVGHVRGDVLLRYLQALDVGLCPYPRTPGNDARVPLRLLHYAAVGATVASTALEEVMRLGFDNVVAAPDDAPGFAEAVVASLDRPGGVPARLEAFDIRTLAARYEAVLEEAVSA